MFPHLQCHEKKALGTVDSGATFLYLVSLFSLEKVALTISGGFPPFTPSLDHLS